MLDRIQTGDVPAKPHTALRDGSGRLRYEECLTRDGFELLFSTEGRAFEYFPQRPIDLWDEEKALRREFRLGV